MREFSKVIFDLSPEMKRDFCKEAIRLGLKQVELFKEMWKFWKEKKK